MHIRCNAGVDAAGAIIIVNMLGDRAARSSSDVIDSVKALSADAPEDVLARRGYHGVGHH